MAASLTLGTEYKIKNDSYDMKFIPVESLATNVKVMMMSGSDSNNSYITGGKYFPSYNWPPYTINQGFISGHYRYTTGRDISSALGMTSTTFYSTLMSMQSDSYNYGIYIPDENKFYDGSYYQTAFRNHINSAMTNLGSSYDGAWGTNGSMTGSQGYVSRCRISDSTSVYQDGANNTITIFAFNIDETKIKVDSNNYITLDDGSGGGGDEPTVDLNPLYLGINNKAIDISSSPKIYFGLNSLAKQVSKIYYGNSNNKSVLIWEKG